mgnify:CR=1 FL=1
MKFSYPPLTSRKCNVLLIGGIVLFLSCQSDPIVLNPPGGYEYIRQTFQLDSANSYSFQGNSHTGKSPRLYAGILSNGDTASALIKLLPGVLDSHQVCTADSIIDVKLELMSSAPIAVQDDTTFIESLIELDSIKAYLISSPQIDEDAVINSDDLTLVSESISGVSSLPIELKTNNSVEIDLFDMNNNIVDRWCNYQEELSIFISTKSSSKSSIFSSAPATPASVCIIIS